MDKNARKCIYSVLFLLIIIENIIEPYVIGLNYFDELFFVFSFAYIFANMRILGKKELVVLIATIFIIIIGLCGNYLYKYNNGNIVIIKDIVAFWKMPVVAIAFKKIGDKEHSSIALDSAYVISRIVIIVMMIFLPISIAFETKMLHGYRKGIPVYRFLYSHPTFMVYAVVLMLAIIIAYGDYKNNWIYQLFCIILLFFTVRDKAYIAIVLYVTIMLIMPNVKKIKLQYLVLAIIGTVIVTYNKLYEYFSYSWSPRYGLYSSGFDIMKKCFPTGSGFGTFASVLSGEYYSKLYSLYGFEHRGGAFVNPEAYSDLGDAGLPYYYAQFGFFGFVAFLLIMVLIYKLIVSKYKINANGRRGAFLLYGYMLSALIVENVFVNESGVTCMIVLFLYLENNNLFTRIRMLLVDIS